MKKVVLFSLSLLIILSCSKFELKAPEKNMDPVVRWTKNFDPVYSSGNLPIGTNAPLIYKGIVYVGSAQNSMNAFDLETGKTIWSKSETSGPSSRPSIFNGKYLVYGSESGRVYSRHYLTGKIEYKIDLGSSVQSPPVFAKGRGIFHLRNHKIVVLDGATGKILWTYKRSVPFATTLHGASEPTVEGNNIFVGFADGYVLSLRLDDGAINWETKISQKLKFIDVDMKPYIAGNKIYVGPKNDNLHVLTKSSGDVVRTLNYMISRGPAVYGEKTIWGTTDGKIIVLGKYDKEVKSINLDEGSVTGLQILNDKLLANSSSGRFYMFNLEGFDKIFSKHFGSVATSLFAPIQVEGDFFTLLSSRNRLYVFEDKL